jgi:hypothetical protein
MSGATMKPALVLRLVKVLGMLGSDHDGEVAVAGRQANTMVKRAGLTWGDVIAPTKLAPPPRRWHEPRSVPDAVALCLRWPEAITEWEANFLRSIARLDRLSEKQMKVLKRVVGKVEAAAAAEEA